MLLVQLRRRFLFPPHKADKSVAQLRREFAHVHDVQVKWSNAIQQQRQRQLKEQGEQHDRQSAEFGNGPVKEQGNMNRNVFKQPLALHSTQPLTGFTRSGYCEVPKFDGGNHSVAGILTNEFLDFSAARGNDLRQIGLKEGCKWCLCVSRWREAFEARTGPDDKKVPRVMLKATNERALEGVSLEDLKTFAVDKE